VEKKRPKIAVVGIGNTLMRDDGVGIEAVQLLKRSSLPENVDLEIIEGGISPDLSVLVDDDVDKLIIIDAVQGGGMPGTIYRFMPEALEKQSEETISPHNIGLKQSLTLMRIVGSLPAETVIIGVEPEDMGFGSGLSPSLQKELPQIIAAVRKEIGPA
jgi:hydrogenase maturation protease